MNAIRSIGTRGLPTVSHISTITVSFAETLYHCLTLVFPTHTVVSSLRHIPKPGYGQMRANTLGATRVNVTCQLCVHVVVSS